VVSKQNMISIADSKQLTPYLAQLVLLDDFIIYNWNETQWLEFIRDYNFCLDMVFWDSKVVAFSLWKVCELENIWHLLKIVVHPDHRKNNIGSKLLIKAINHVNVGNLESLFLEVGSDNLAAIKLYEKCGFIKLHLQKSFYSDGADAYIMQRSIRVAN
jgi:ribosomal protein S18 acetylase RimI-like enzyme